MDASFVHCILADWAKRVKGGKLNKTSRKPCAPIKDKLN